MREAPRPRLLRLDGWRVERRSDSTRLSSCPVLVMPPRVRGDQIRIAPNPPLKIAGPALVLREVGPIQTVEGEHVVGAIGVAVPERSRWRAARRWQESASGASEAHAASRA